MRPPVLSSQNASATVWIPTAAEIQSTHIAALQKQLQLDSYLALHQWSVKHRECFWELMVQRLNIRLQRPYSRFLDLSQGVAQPQWLKEARMNIVESCFNAPGEDTAIVFQSPGQPLASWSYGTLEAMTNRVANGLKAMGVKKGDAIAIVLPMSAEAVAIYLGIIKVGGVVIGIADSFSPAEMSLRLTIAQAHAPLKAIFTQEVIWRRGKVLPLYTEVVAAQVYTKVIASQAPRTIVLDAQLPLDDGVERPTLRRGDCRWRDFLSANDQFTAVACAPDDATNILFSSGTTGTPKAIPWNHTTPIKCAADAHLHHDIHTQDVVAWPTSLGWMMGPWLIYASLINRATMALYLDAPSDRGFGEFVQNVRVNLLGVVPSLVSSWKQSQCMNDLDWSAIKAFSSTGECSNPEDMAFLMGLAGHKPIIEYCGGTEIGGSYITGTLVQPARPATFTTPALGLDIMILDAAGKPSSQGEVFIVPPSIGLSTTLLNRDHHQVYFADTPSSGLPGVTLRRHGDHIEQFSDGSHRYYRAQGRVDDTMNLGGIKISAVEIERVFQSVEGLANVAAIALSPPAGGPSKLVLYVVLSGHHVVDKKTLLVDVQKMIRQRLNPLFKVHDIVIVETLPCTASHKVMRRELRSHYRSINLNLS